MWEEKPSNKPQKNDVHEERIGFLCPINAPRHQYHRMLQLRLSRSRNKHDQHLAPEMRRRKQATWGCFKTIEDAVSRTRNTQLCARLFLHHDRRHDERAISIMKLAIEGTMLKVSRFMQARELIRSFDVRRRPDVKDIVQHSKLSMVKWQPMTKSRSGFFEMSNVLQEDRMVKVLHENRRRKK